MEKQSVIFEDLGLIQYKEAWEYQEKKLNENLKIKSLQRNKVFEKLQTENLLTVSPSENFSSTDIHMEAKEVSNEQDTSHYLLFCEHPPVYTLGKSGHIENVLLQKKELEEKHIEFFRTNRGGDITFHGPQQLVGYPIMDLEKFTTDIGLYLRNLEEVIIRTLCDYGITGCRSKGETGVWIDPGIKGKERKICAMGIRCSRWVTMHGFALNVNTDLEYFSHIIPCGIVDKKVTSMKEELGQEIDLEALKSKVLCNFAEVFNVRILRNKVIPE